MAHENTIVETLQRLFMRTDAKSPAQETIDRFARLRSRPRAPIPPRTETFTRERGVQRSKIEEDPFLLWQETEFFGTRPPDDLGETQQRPIPGQLWGMAALAWLFTIDPVFQALTPRNFSGIPAPQLMAVVFVLGLMSVAVLWIWARVLGPHARVFVRTQFNHWKRWLVVGFVILCSRSILS